MTLTMFARVMTIASLFVLLAATPAVWAQTEQPEVDLYGVEGDTGRLYHITTDSGGSLLLELVADTGIPDLAGLEYANGHLFAFTAGFDPLLYEFALDGTVVGFAALDANLAGEGALTLGPGGMAYGINASPFSYAPKLFSFAFPGANPAATPLSTIPVDTVDVDAAGVGGALDINGLAWLDGHGATGGTLLALDRVTNALIGIDPETGDTWTVKDIPSTNVVGGVGGMALAQDGKVFFSTSGPRGLNPGSNELWWYDPESYYLGRVDGFPTSGGSTLNGGPTISGVGISGLAVVPEPATLSLLLLGGLALLRRRRA